MSDDATTMLLKTLLAGQDKAVDRLDNVAKSVSTLAETTASGFGDIKAECAEHAVQIQATTGTLEKHIAEDRDNFKILHADIGEVHKRITDNDAGGKGGKSTAVKAVQWSGIGTAIAAALAYLVNHFKGG